METVIQYLRESIRLVLHPYFLIFTFMTFVNVRNAVQTLLNVQRLISIQMITHILKELVTYIEALQRSTTSTIPEPLFVIVEVCMHDYVFKKSATSSKILTSVFPIIFD